MPLNRSGNPSGVLPDWDFAVIMEPSAAQVYQDVLKLEGLIHDWTRPMQYSKQILIDETKRGFYEQLDPRTDEPWQDWSPNYKKHGSAILRRTGKLFGSATNPSNWLITRTKTDGTIQLNVSRLPWYWQIHQFGYPPEGSKGAFENMPVGRQRQLVANTFKRLFSSGQLKGMNKNEAISHAAKTARLEMNEVLIPKRGFIAGGRKSDEKIYTVMDGWARDAIRIDRWRKSGRGSSRLVMRSI